MKFYKVCINHDPEMTLTYFTARSTSVTNAFEWEKLVKCNQIGILAGSMQVDRRFMFMKIFCPQGLSAPGPGLYTCI